MGLVVFGPDKLFWVFMFLGFLHWDQRFGGYIAG